MNYRLTAIAVIAALLLLPRGIALPASTKRTGQPGNVSGMQLLAEDTLVEYLTLLSRSAQIRDRDGENIDAHALLTRRLFIFWFNTRYGYSRDVQWRAVPSLIGFLIDDSGLTDRELSDPLRLNEKVRQGFYADPLLTRAEPVLGLTIDWLRDEARYTQLMKSFLQDMESAHAAFLRKNPHRSRGPGFDVSATNTP